MQSNLLALKRRRGIKESQLNIFKGHSQKVDWAWLGLESLFYVYAKKEEP